MAKQVQRAIGWVAAFLLAVGMLFLPVSKAYAGPVSGGSPGSGEMRGVWVSYLDWNGWAKDEAGYKKAMDQTLDLCVQKGLNAVFLQVRPDGDAMYPSQYFPWSKFASGKQGKNPGYDPLAYAVQAAHQRGLQLHAWINPYRITGYLNRYSDLCASNPAIAWAKDGDSSNDRWVLCQNGEYYYNPAIPQVRQLIIDGVKEIVTNYEVDGIHFDDYFYPNLDDSKAETWFDYPEYQAGGTSLSVAAWRRNNVNELVRGVYSAVKSIRPQALFGISPDGKIGEIDKKSYTKWLNYDKIKVGLQIRTRTAGDYLTVDDRGHTKKLKEYFINEKVPKEMRDTMLLLTEDSHVIWAVGQRISADYKIDENTKKILEVHFFGGNYHESKEY